MIQDQYLKKKHYLFLKDSDGKAIKKHLIQNLKDTKMTGKELVKEIRDG